MPEKPILFSGEMVRAIMEGRKTQTRRVIQPKPTDGPTPLYHHGKRVYGLSNALGIPEALGIWDVCPYGRPGDKLWVRETWRCEERGEHGLDGVCYKADGKFIPIQNTKEASDAWLDARREGDPWRPSIFMPRWASRITLEVVSVRVERVQEISREDCFAEGIAFPEKLGPERMFAARISYQGLWDRINAKRGFGWDVNPWVWVINFKRTA